MIGFVGAGVTLIPSVITDVRKKELPVWLLALSGILGILAALILEGTVWWRILLSLVPGAVLLGLSRITRDAIGFGDGILVMALGAWLGAVRVTEVLLAAFFLAGIFGLVATLARRRRSLRIPFAPFLFVGAAFAVTAELLNGGAA